MMRISDGSSDLCSADLPVPSLAALHLHELGAFAAHALHKLLKIDERLFGSRKANGRKVCHHLFAHRAPAAGQAMQIIVVEDARMPICGFMHVQLEAIPGRAGGLGRSHDRAAEHTADLPSLIRISYAVFSVKK